MGMLLVGVLIYVLWTTKGHYFIEGVGYSSIQAILRDQIPGCGLPC